MKLGYKGCNGRYRHDNSLDAGAFMYDVIHYGIPVIAGILAGDAALTFIYNLVCSL